MDQNRIILSRLSKSDFNHFHKKSVGIVVFNFRRSWKRNSP